VLALDVTGRAPGRKPVLRQQAGGAALGGAAGDPVSGPTESIHQQLTGAGPPGEIDSTETIRREMITVGVPESDLAENRGQTWDAAGLQHDFEVTGFMAPFVAVRRRSDGAVGSMEFVNSPRRYFGFQADE